VRRAELGGVLVERELNAARGTSLPTDHLFSAKIPPQISKPANMRLDGTHSGKHRFRAPWRQPMRTRPTSITVIAWILILMGGISLVTTTLMINPVMNNPAIRELMSKSPVPVPVQYAMTYVALLVMLVSGVAMLKGQNWGRWLYVVGTALSFLIGIVTSPLKGAMIPGFVVFVMVTFFLFRPKANTYFSDQESAHDTQSA